MPQQHKSTTDEQSAPVAEQDIQVMAEKLARHVMARKETILEAFIAEHGCLPSECIMVQDGLKWYVRRKTAEDVERERKAAAPSPAQEKQVAARSKQQAIRTAIHRIDELLADGPFMEGKFSEALHGIIEAAIDEVRASSPSEDTKLLDYLLATIGHVYKGLNTREKIRAAMSSPSVTQQREETE